MRALPLASCFRTIGESVATPCIRALHGRQRITEGCGCFGRYTSALRTGRQRITGGGGGLGRTTGALRRGPERGAVVSSHVIAAMPPPLTVEAVNRPNGPWIGGTGVSVARSDPLARPAAAAEPVRT